MNKNIIIAILVVIIIAIGATLVLGQGKENTQINIINNETFQNGEQVQFELKDSKGNAISGQNVSIIFNKNETYSVNTDSNGKGYLLISGEDNGKYEIEVKYDGNNKYNGCSAKVTINITSDVPDRPATQTSTSVVSTNQYNKDPVSNSSSRSDSSSSSSSSSSSGQESKKSSDNPFPGEAGTYFVSQYELWVRSSDQVVIDSPNGNGVGLTLTDWIALYGPGSPEFE